MNDEPPRATLIKWLRFNLGLSIFITSLVTGGIGFVVKGTLQYSDYANRLDTLETWRKDNIDPAIRHIDPVENHVGNLEPRVVGLEQDRHERDNRRSQLRDDLGTINSKIDVLTAKVDMLNQRTGWTADNLPRHK